MDRRREAILQTEVAQKPNVGLAHFLTVATSRIFIGITTRYRSLAKARRKRWHLLAIYQKNISSSGYLNIIRTVQFGASMPMVYGQRLGG